MSQSVKLKDGSYIDASGVWDNTQGKSQEAINAIGEIHTVNAKDYFSDVTSGTISWCRFGHLVILAFNQVTPTNEDYHSVSISALNMPKPLLAPDNGAWCSGYAAGQIGCTAKTLYFVFRPENYVTNMSGAFIYFTDDLK